MKKFIFSMFVLLFFSTATQAKVEFDLEDFLEAEGSSLQMGYVNIDSNSYLKAAINPDLQINLGLIRHADFIPQIAFQVLVHSA